MANPLLCVFNPVTSFIDEVQSVSTGPAAIGVPIVTNVNGLIDASLIGSGLAAVTAGESVSGGNLVSLYSVGGVLKMQLAWAGTGGTGPSGQSYPISANGFVTTGTTINGFGIVQFSGIFTYIDGFSEFGPSDVGAEVYLSATNGNRGGITKTRPSGIGQLQQTVGTVVNFTNPNVVQVSFVPVPNPPLLNFGNISTGTNTTATMTLGSGATLTFSGSGVVNANQLTGDPVNTSGRTTGQALVWNGTTWVPSNSAATSFSAITSGTNSTATMTVASGAALTFSGSGTVNASQLVGVTISTTPPTVGQVLTATSPTAANWQSSGSGSPGAPFTSVQFNNAGAFGGSANMEWDNTLFTLGVGLGFGDGTLSSDIGYSSTATGPVSLLAGTHITDTVNASNHFPAGAGIGALYTGSAVLSTSILTGLNVQAQQFGTGSLTSVFGISAFAYNQTGTITSSLIGGRITTEIDAGSAQNAYGVQVSNFISGTVTGEIAGLSVQGNFGGGTYTGINISGIHIADQKDPAPTAPPLAYYGILIDNQTSPANAIKTGTGHVQFGDATSVAASGTPGQVDAIAASAWAGAPVAASGFSLLDVANTVTALPTTPIAAPISVGQSIGFRANPSASAAAVSYVGELVAIDVPSTNTQAFGLVAGEAVVANFASTGGAGEIVAGNFIANFNSASGAVGIFGVSAIVNVNGGGTISTSAFAVTADSFHGGTATVGQIGCFAGQALLGGTGNITEQDGVIVQTGIAGGTGNVTNDYSINVESPAFLGGSGNLTHHYGLFIDDQTNGGARNPDPWAIKVIGGVSSFTGVATAIVTQIATYTATQNDFTILGDTSGGAFTIHLPVTGIKVGQTYRIKNIGNPASNLTIDTVGGIVLIDFGTSQILAAQGSSMDVQWDGTQWWIL